MPPKPDPQQARMGRSEKRSALRALESREVGIEAVLRAPYEPLDRADVWEVLIHTPKLGRNGAKRVCLESGVFPHQRLGELSEVERGLLLAALPRRVRQATN